MGIIVQTAGPEFCQLHERPRSASRVSIYTLGLHGCASSIIGQNGPISKPVVSYRSSGSIEGIYGSASSDYGGDLLCFRLELS